VENERQQDQLCCKEASDVTISFLYNQPRGFDPTTADWLRLDPAIRRFHCSLPDFSPTPLVELPGLAKRLGVGRVFVKDESKRLGLAAFKVLGVSYAVARLLADKLQLDISELSFPSLRSLVRERLPNATFTTATDGNHGRGLAWIAHQLGLRSVIYLPQGAAEARRQAIQDCGGNPVVTDLNYDEAVRLAAEQARENGWWLVQDTALTGYEQIPAWIMQGYTTMAAEAREQLQAAAASPTHLFLQAGVGSMAAAVQGYWLCHDGSDFRTVIAEPEQAACYHHSIAIGDGRAHAVTGDLATIMAGLSCGEPNPLAWPLLRDTACAFASCPDFVAEQGMRALARPAPGDPQVVAGESGAVGIGMLVELSRNLDLAYHRQRLGLDEHSTVLVFNTEGATDPVNYHQVVCREG
jgi:diaminopropionate ammonia-lyase